VLGGCRARVREKAPEKGGGGHEKQDRCAKSKNCILKSRTGGALIDLVGDRTVFWLLHTLSSLGVILFSICFGDPQVDASSIGRAMMYYHLHDWLIVGQGTVLGPDTFHL
jgi:hypothetical protein